MSSTALDYVTFQLMDIGPHFTTFASDGPSEITQPLLTSSIDRLPTELISDIFLALLEPYNLFADIDTIDATRATLLAVCIYWRTLILNHPALWTCFAFVVTKKKLTRWDEYMAWVAIWAGRRSPNADLHILVRSHVWVEVKPLRRLAAFLKAAMFRQAGSLEIDHGRYNELASCLFPLRSGAMPRLASVKICGQLLHHDFRYRFFSGDAHTPDPLRAPLLSEVIIHGGCIDFNDLKLILPSFPALEKLHIASRHPREPKDSNPITLPRLKTLSVYHPETFPLRIFHAPQLLELHLNLGRFLMFTSRETIGPAWLSINQSLLTPGFLDPFPQLRTVRMQVPAESAAGTSSFYDFVWMFINARPHVRVLWYTADDIDPTCDFRVVGCLLARILYLEELHLSFSARSGLRNKSGVWIEGFLKMWLAMRGLLARAETLKLWWSLKAPEPESDVERMCAELSSEYPGRFITSFTDV